jgi:hypothetical protein
MPLFQNIRGRFGFQAFDDEGQCLKRPNLLAEFNFSSIQAIEV